MSRRRLTTVARSLCPGRNESRCPRVAWISPRVAKDRCIASGRLEQPPRSPSADRNRARDRIVHGMARRANALTDPSGELRVRVPSGTPLQSTRASLQAIATRPATPTECMSTPAPPPARAQAAKRQMAPAGAKGSLRVSMYPDRPAETPREVDLSDLGTALATEPALGLLAAPAVDRTRTGGDRCLHQPPAQTAGAVLRQRAAVVTLA
jgi:hypothetical protein